MTPQAAGIIHPLVSRRCFAPRVWLAPGTHLDRSSQYPSQPRAINNCDVMVGSSGPFADAESREHSPGTSHADLVT